MILGFTGTRQGLTPQQRAALPSVLAVLPERVLHGGAVGADSEFHQFIIDAGISMGSVEIYPSGNCIRWIGKGWFLHELKPPLVRNRIIAKRCDRLLACPATADEELRSGTWATVRYARQAGKPVTIITPDGSVREEKQ